MGGVNGGRWAAETIAAGSVLMTAGLCYWSSDNYDIVKAAWGALVSASVFMPGAWFVGGKYDQLKEAAARDFLTGLYSRRFIEQCFPGIALKALRERQRMTVILLDVNDFKEVNDCFGHEGGDKALRLIAGELAACSEGGEMIGRWGGDEFIVVCPYCDDKRMEKYVRQLHDQLRKLSMTTGLALSVSAGNVHFPDQGEELGALVKIADKRMYADKHLRKAQAFDSEVLQA